LDPMALEELNCYWVLKLSTILLAKLLHLEIQTEVLKDVKSEVLNFNTMIETGTKNSASSNYIHCAKNMVCCVPLWRHGFLLEVLISPSRSLTVWRSSCRREECWKASGREI
jgi:hypothetical protein